MALMATVAAAVTVVLVMVVAAEAGDHNPNFEPCVDTKIQRWDGFTFGVALAPRDSFFFNNTQLSPCDHRLALSSSAGAQLAVFRPKVDEISLLTVNTSSLSSASSVGYMVAFAGRKYAARSLPAFVGNGTYTVTSFTLVLEFQKGTLQNLYWKRDGCSSCSGKSSFVCLNNQDCAIKTSNCKDQGGSVDCSLGIQLAFSGTDKHEVVLNSCNSIGVPAPGLDSQDSQRKTPPFLMETEGTVVQYCVDCSWFCYLKKVMLKCNEELERHWSCCVVRKENQFSV
ncbi:hypothetical protein J5N97_027472 [Dioscorea zingiberensis]|uniref:Uncharacterized protein n=1 Tax=Dioscorea zingiberensis TaxID=325984 RepID=A0A9D5H7N7_9LILI|nr:hypothetical protein J5N97_027472 [Dioscorea zingiberensis]